MEGGGFNKPCARIWAIRSLMFTGVGVLSREVGPVGVDLDDATEGVGVETVEDREPSENPAIPLGVRSIFIRLKEVSNDTDLLAEGDVGGIERLCVEAVEEEARDEAELFAVAIRLFERPKGDW